MAYTLKIGPSGTPFYVPDELGGTPGLSFICGLSPSQREICILLQCAPRAHAVASGMAARVLRAGQLDMPCFVSRPDRSALFFARRLHLLTLAMNTWKGPISAAIYVPLVEGSIYFKTGELGLTMANVINRLSELHAAAEKRAHVV
jgi:hypothetical protein